MRLDPRCLLLCAPIAGACSVEPERPVLRWALRDDLGAVDPETGEPKLPAEVQRTIESALAGLFGTPSDPHLPVGEAWKEEGFDPNFPARAATEGGSGEIAPAELEELRAQNRVRFARELAAIDEGRFEDALPPTSMPALRAAIAELAGTPAAARDAAARARAQALLVDWYPTLRDSAELYRQQCLHCHGVEGGGDGPTARFLEPLPRDYRKGIFKFTALKDKAMPRRADLRRVLEDGVTGTAMPSFARFSRAELEGLVDYVRLLSMRGMVENDLALTWENDEELPEGYPQESFLDVWERWGRAGAKLVAFDGEVPPPSPERIARGKQLFHDATKGNCASCHGEGGRGGGPSAWIADANGAIVPALKDEWGHPILPRDLTQGVFHGGKRPIDVYRRIWAGINGTPMPGLGESKDAHGELLLSSEDLWSLVHYVRSLAAVGGAGA